MSTLKKTLALVDIGNADMLKEAHKEITLTLTYKKCPEIFIPEQPKEHWRKGRPSKW